MGTRYNRQMFLRIFRSRKYGQVKRKEGRKEGRLAEVGWETAIYSRLRYTKGPYGPPAKGYEGKSLKCVQLENRYIAIV